MVIGSGGNELIHIMSVLFGSVDGDDARGRPSKFGKVSTVAGAPQ